MAAKDMAQLIIDKLEAAIGSNGENYTSSSPISANQAIADAVTEYLLDNTMIQVSYSGIIPSVPTAPDPLKVDFIEISGSCSAPNTADYSDGGSTSAAFLGWITSLTDNIKAGFMVSSGQAGVSPITPLPCFIVPPTFLGTLQGMLTGVSGDNIQLDAWTVICQQIIAWLSTCMGVTYSASNSNTSSVGPAVTTSVTIT